MIHDICRIAICLAIAHSLLGCSGPTEPQKLPQVEQLPESNKELAARSDQEPPQPAPIGVQASAAESGDTATEESTAAPATRHEEAAGSSSSGSTRVTSATLNRRPIELSFDDIKFDIKPGDPFEKDMLPESVSQYFGKRIRIRGYILPSYKQSGLTQFVLVRDNLECCFGPGAALYDCIRVEMEPGKATEFSVRPVAVEGVFSLEEFYGPDDMHLAIYYMTGEAVK